MPDYSSPMLDAFMANQKFTDQEAADKEAAIQLFQQEQEKAARSQLANHKNISDHIDIPSTVKPEDIKQVTEPHPKLKDYDHSLEMARIRVDETGADVLADGVKIPEPEPEGLRLLPHGFPEMNQDPNDAPDMGINWDSLKDTLENIGRSVSDS